MVIDRCTREFNGAGSNTTPTFKTMPRIWRPHIGYTAWIILIAVLVYQRLSNDEKKTATLTTVSIPLFPNDTTPLSSLTISSLTSKLPEISSSHPALDGRVILTFVTPSFVHHLGNFLCFLHHRIGLFPGSYIVGTSDRAFATQLAEAGITTLFVGEDRAGDNADAEVAQTFAYLRSQGDLLPRSLDEALEAGGLWYQKLMLERTLTMTFLAERTNDIRGLLLVDNDAVWLSSPLQNIPDAAFAASLDMDFKWRTPWGTREMACACFLYSNCKHEAVVQVWRHISLCHQKAIRQAQEGVDASNDGTALSFQQGSLGPVLELARRGLLPKISRDDFMQALRDNKAGTCLDDVFVEDDDGPLPEFEVTPTPSNITFDTVFLSNLSFPNGKQFFQDRLPQQYGVEPLVVHANFASGNWKQRILQEQGLWALRDPDNNLLNTSKVDISTMARWQCDVGSLQQSTLVDNDGSRWVESIASRFANVA